MNRNKILNKLEREVFELTVVHQDIDLFYSAISIIKQEYTKSGGTEFEKLYNHCRNDWYYKLYGKEKTELPPLTPVITKRLQKPKQKKIIRDDAVRYYIEIDSLNNHTPSTDEWRGRTEFQGIKWVYGSIYTRKCEMIREKLL